MIEKMPMVTWHTPKEKMPERWETVVATISGHARGVEYDHAFALLDWTGTEWDPVDIHLDEFTVHAWCDLEPYGKQGVMV